MIPLKGYNCLIIINQKSIYLVRQSYNTPNMYFLFIGFLLRLPDSLRQSQSEARGGASLESIRGTAHRSHPQPVWEHASWEEVPAHHHGVVGSSISHTDCSTTVHPDPPEWFIWPPFTPDKKHLLHRCIGCLFMVFKTH